MWQRPYSTMIRMILSIIYLCLTMIMTTKHILRYYCICLLLLLIHLALEIQPVSCLRIAITCLFVPPTWIPRLNPTGSGSQTRIRACWLATLYWRSPGASLQLVRGWYARSNRQPRIGVISYCSAFSTNVRAALLAVSPSLSAPRDWSMTSQSIN